MCLIRSLGRNINFFSNWRTRAISQQTMNKVKTSHGELLKTKIDKKIDRLFDRCDLCIDPHSKLKKKMMTQIFDRLKLVDRVAD